MKIRWIGIAATALVVGTGPAWAATTTDASGGQPKTPETKRAAALTASAWAALGKGDAIKAVKDAEAATLLLPQDGGTRLLLGRAYLAAGRFVSAETAFGDALTLDASLSRAAVSRALAQIALGKTTAARASLAMVDGVAPDADIGLAEALLGDTDAARTRLDTAARANGADARTRQNLGLAYALEGRWVDAVAIAQQDIPADMMPQRLRRWAMIAQLKSDPSMQVGAILGVLPAIDEGQPGALALAAPVAPVEPVQLAEAEASTTVAPFLGPVVRTEGGSVVTELSHVPPSLAELVTVPVVIPDGIVPWAELHLASAPEAIEVPEAVSAKVEAWAGPPRARAARAARWGDARPSGPKMAKPATLVAVSTRPSVRKPLMLASQITLKHSPGKDLGRWAVQLGAFSSKGRTQIAWGMLSAKAAYLSAYTPTGSGRRLGKSMVYRLSVSGIATRQEAISLCVRIRSNGGDCFVRNMGGDRPMQWASAVRTERAA